MSDDFSAWVGRTEAVSDVLEPARSNALQAALGEHGVGNGLDGGGTLVLGDPLPLLHHWLYFWNVVPPAGLGPDGHPAKGGFLPPVPLPRRMWAGGRVRFHAPLLLGETALRISTILKVETKVGKSGTLVFVTVRHELSGAAGLAVTEEQDLVYRAPAEAGSMAAPGAGDTPDAAFSRVIEPDPVLLFRYSALTMNGHRIHYDRPYAMEQEAYPGLVVHGPLQATLMAGLAAEMLGGALSSFDFRGQAPAFAGTTLHVCGELGEAGAEMWTQQGGLRCMVATAL